MGKSGNPAKRNETPEPVVYDRAPDADEFGTEDFDAFWSARDRKTRKTKIMGVEVTLPASLPLRFEMEARRLERSRSDDDVRKLVAVLFGPDALDQWTTNGMDAEQFAVLLAWAPRVIVGQDVTLAEVADAIAEAQAGDESGEA